MRTLKAVALSSLLASIAAADLPREKHVVDKKPLPVTAKNELTFKARSDADVKVRELWYARRGQDGWGSWERHGVTFGRDNPIVWSPPEGHWKTYIRIEEISGLATPIPTAETNPSIEFIADRTAPKAGITFPSDGTKLMGSSPYNITWTVTDPHLHSTPISLYWAHDQEAEFKLLAEALPNSGTWTWNTPRDMTPAGRLKIVATDKAGNSSSAQVSGLTIDSISPRTKILGPTINASHQVALATSAHDGGPAGLAWVKLFYTNDGGATWSEGPQKADAPFESLDWKAPSDGDYGLVLVAADKAGNTSKIPAEAADIQAKLLVDTEKPVITLTTATGLRMAGASTDGPVRRVFKPGDRVQVDFRAQDQNLAADAASVYLQQETDAPWQPLGQNLPVNQAFTFDIPNISSASCRIKVQVIDLAGNPGEVVAGETFRVDNQVETGDVEVDF